MTGGIWLANGSDMLVWVAVIWAAFRIADTVATLGTAAGTAAAGAIRRHLTRRRIARKWETFKAEHPEVFDVPVHPR